MIKVHKAKIPTHLSFALKTSMLENALEEVDSTCPVELDYHEPELTGALFEARFCPPSGDYDTHYLHVLAGAVPGEARKEMGNLLKEKVLLEFMVWLEQLQKRPASAPAMQKTHVFQAIYRGGQLHILQEP